MKRCDFGHPIEGRYFEYEGGAVVCERHERGSPRCARCGVPRPSLDRSGLCPGCAKDTPACSACGRRVLRWQAFRDRPDRRYCHACFSSLEACDFCCHPAAKGGKRLSDGRIACAPCGSDLVVEPFRIRHFFPQVREAVEKHAGLKVRSEVVLKIVAPDEMAALTGLTFSPTHRLDVRPLGLFTFKGGKRTIHLEVGLPRAILLTTCAHEFGHAWQSEFCESPAVPFLAEGFSEWVGHRIAMKAKFREEARRIETRGDVYGEGFRAIIRLQRKLGTEEMIRIVRDRLRRHSAK